MGKVSWEEFVRDYNHARNIVGRINLACPLFFNDRAGGTRYYLSGMGIVMKDGEGNMEYADVEEFYNLLKVFRRGEFSVPGEALDFVHGVLEHILENEEQTRRRGFFLAGFDYTRFFE